MSRARRLARDLLPPALTRALVGRPPGQLVFEDGFDSWTAACDAAAGYDAATILAQVRRATDEVVAGRSAMERDGVLFDHLEVRWPVAGPLLWQAARHGGSLRVVDYGGSLGSTYRQLSALTVGVNVRWAVVEQPAFVAAGADYADGRLSFHPTIADAVSAVGPTVALLSSVLQYLPDPHSVLRELAASGVEGIVVDRTPMTDDDADRPAVEHVPPEIYAGSYATWLLSEERLLDAVPGWQVLDRFAGIEPDGRTTGGVGFDWRGFVLVPRP